MTRSWNFLVSPPLGIPRRFRDVIDDGLRDHRVDAVVPLLCELREPAMQLRADADQHVAGKGLLRLLAPAQLQVAIDRDVEFLDRPGGRSRPRT